MSDRMAVMNRGALEQVGPKLELYESPRTRFVAAFVGSANRVQGKIRGIEGSVARIDWDGNELLGAAPEGAAVGDSVDYFIKPERIAIEPIEGARMAGGHTRLEARLRDVIFKGQYSDYIVTLENGSELVISGPPALEGLRPRAGVVLHWAAEVADVFPAEAE